MPRLLLRGRKRWALFSLPFLLLAAFTGLLLTPARKREVDEKKWAYFKELSGAPVHYLLSHGESRIFLLANGSSLATDWWTQHQSSFPDPAVVRCWQVPQPWQIKVNNWHWQVTTVPAKKNVEEKEEEEEEDGLLPQTLYLYSAHYDDRRRGEEGADRIRILVISDSGQPRTGDLSCLLWYRQRRIAESPVDRLEHLVHDSSFLLSCPVPAGPAAASRRDPGDPLPLAVSLVSADGIRWILGVHCQVPSNFLGIAHHLTVPGRKLKPVAVCTRGLMYPRLEPRLATRVMEWIELIRILGADKVLLYYYEAEAHLMEALRLYETQGLVDLRQISLSGNRASESWLQEATWERDLRAREAHDGVFLADCFYRAVNEYEYVAALHAEEVILPRRATGGGWPDMVRAMDGGGGGGGGGEYGFYGYHFLDWMQRGDGDGVKDVPDYFYMIRQVYRSERRTPATRATLFKTSQVSAPTWHPRGDCNASRCLTGFSQVDDAIAHLARYGRTCQAGLPRDVCKGLASEIRKDAVTLRFKDELVRRMTQTLRELNFLVEDGEEHD